MKSIFEISLIVVLLLISNGLTAQEQDTLHFIIYGDFKKTEKFQLRNWNKYICEFNSDSCFVEADVIIDLKENEPFTFSLIGIYKWNWFKRRYINTNIPIVYYPDLKYIYIYYLPDIFKDFQIFYMPYKKFVL